MSSALLSVVVPTYNYARFLEDSIGSVAEQTYGRIELVVVDDCSTDDTPQVLSELARRHRDRFENVRILRNERNAGAHASLNRAVQAAAGSFICVLNADDLYEKNRLVELYSALCEEDAELAFSAVRCVDGEGRPLRTKFARKIESLPSRVEDRVFALLGAVAENVAASTGNMLFTRDLYDAIGGFQDYQYVHDYDFLLKAMLRSEPVHTDRTSYVYRIHGENSFTRLTEIGIPENRLVWLDLYGRIKAGRVTNPRILADEEYQKDFYEAVCEYGFQKKALWRMAGTPLGTMVERLMRAKLRKDRQRRDA